MVGQSSSLLEPGGVGQYAAIRDAYWLRREGRRCYRTNHARRR
jgi:hypothetical protein